MFGNALDGARQIENMLFPRLVALHTPHLSVKASSFTEKGMFSSDPRDKLSKDGSGRVGVFLATDLCHCYTLEVNYHTGIVRLLCCTVQVLYCALYGCCTVMYSCSAVLYSCCTVL